MLCGPHGCADHARVAEQGLSNHRWIVDGKLAVALNKWGVVCAWDVATSNVHDSAFQPLVSRFAEDMIVLADSNFARKEGNPPTLKVGLRSTWNDRMLVETTFSMLTLICHAKHALHRVWRYFSERLAVTVALFNILVQGGSLVLYKPGCAYRSIAQFSL